MPITPAFKMSSPLRTAAAAAMLLALVACSKPASTGPAHTAFDALTATCAEHLAARTPSVQQGPDGQWVQAGYSAAQVRSEVEPTESAVTPFVGKIVIKDNEAQATADTETQARAITLTPDHLRTNRTHTFIYRYDGERWQWANGQLLVKRPPQDDTVMPVTLAELQALGGQGLAGCLPR